MRTVEERIGARLARAHKGGLASIYLWNPSASEITAFSDSSDLVEWGDEGERLRNGSLQMLGETLDEETGLSFLKLAVGIDKQGALVAFALIDDNSDERGRELITLAAIEGQGFGSALLVAAGAGAHSGALIEEDTELVLYSDPGVESYYDKMGLEGKDGWRRWGSERCANMGALLSAAGIEVYEQAPVGIAKAIEIG